MCDVAQLKLQGNLITYGPYGETYQKSWLLSGLLKLGEAVFVLSKVQAGVGPKHGEHSDHGEQLFFFGGPGYI